MNANVAWRLASGLLHRGPQPRVVEGSHAVDLRQRPQGGPCRAEQCPLGLPLPGLGPAPRGGLTTNSRWTGADRRDLAAVDGGRGLPDGRLAGHYGPIISRSRVVVSGHPPRPTSGLPPAHGARSRRLLGRTCHRAAKSHADCHGIGRDGGRHRRRMPDVRRHASRCFNPGIQRVGIREFETHTSMAGRKRRPIVLMKEMDDDAREEREKRENPRCKRQLTIFPGLWSNLRLGRGSARAGGSILALQAEASKAGYLTCFRLERLRRGLLDFVLFVSSRDGIW